MYQIVHKSQRKLCRAPWAAEGDESLLLRQHGSRGVGLTNKDVEFVQLVPDHVGVDA